jgi:O-antigen ligase
VTRARRPGTVIIVAAFFVTLLGRFGLRRIGSGFPDVDLRLVVVPMLLLLLAAETALRDADQRSGSPVKTTGFRWYCLLLSFLGISLLWSPPGARVGSVLVDLASSAALVFVYQTLARWDAERTIRVTLRCFLVAALVYFAVAASGRGHDPSGRWAALGGGSNVFVRVMILGAVGAGYFYSRSGRLLYLLPLPVFFVGAILSGSRGGLLAAALAAVPNLRGRLRYVRMSRLVPVLVLTPLLLALAWVRTGPILEAVVQERFIALTVHGRYTSQRDVLFAEGVDLFRRSPVWGSGSDAYYANYYGRLNIAGQINVDRYVHNLPLAVASEGGLIGLFLLWMTLLSWRAPHKGRVRLPERGFAVYCAMYIGAAALFSGDFYDARWLWIFLLLAAAITHTDAAERAEEPVSAKKSEKVLAASSPR